MHSHYVCILPTQTMEALLYSANHQMLFCGADAMCNVPPLTMPSILSSNLHSFPPISFNLTTRLPFMPGTVVRWYWSMFTLYNVVSPRCSDVV